MVAEAISAYERAPLVIGRHLEKTDGLESHCGEQPHRTISWKRRMGRHPGLTTGG